MAIHVRKNDIVEVIAGDHKGARGKVLRVDPRRGTVVVEGVNVVFRHVKPTQKNPQGGRIQKEAAIPICKVLPFDASAGKGRRVHFELEQEEGGRVVSKRRVTTSGTTMHTLTRAERVRPGQAKSG